MEKPVLVKRSELIQKLTNDINEASLPLVIIQPIVQDILNAVNAQLREEYEKESAEYARSLKESETAIDCLEQDGTVEQ